MPKVQILKSHPSLKTEHNSRRRGATNAAQKVVKCKSAGRKYLAPTDAALPLRTTKQDAVLTLLSRVEGASVGELSAATSWQTHSVRGFLAGTVKKKLGFVLSSSKSEDGVRRYRIEPRRGR